jgi:acyl dehydratase
MASSYDRLQLGDRFKSPTLILDEERAEQMIRWGGYVHPMFSDRNYAKTVGFKGRPVPGELVLLFLGGLAEQTGAFDDTTLALVEVDHVTFKTPALVGDTIHVEMEVSNKRLSGSRRRGFLTFNWTCRNQSNEVVLETHATFAFRTG